MDYLCVRCLLEATWICLPYFPAPALSSALPVSEILHDPPGIRLGEPRIQCAIASDEAEGLFILQDLELVAPDAPEHKVAAAVGVDTAQKAVLEGETAPDCVVVADFVDEGARATRKCETRAAESSYVDYANCCRLAALGDGYRQRNASCRLGLVGRRYQSCVSCLESQWTCGNFLRTWRSRHLGYD